MFGNRLVKRKWGWYLTLLDRKHFKVKLLRFWQDLECSRQYHNSRNELWLLLKGYGTMRVGEKVDGFHAGEFREVAAGAVHKFVALYDSWVLEIQYGERCVEDDIVRV